MSRILRSITVGAFIFVGVQFSAPPAAKACNYCSTMQTAMGTIAYCPGGLAGAWGCILTGVFPYTVCTPIGSGCQTA